MALGERDGEGGEDGCCVRERCSVCGGDGLRRWRWREMGEDDG